MGFASMLLGEKNPFAQWITENQNKIGAAAGGFAAGPDFGAGLSNAAQYAAQAAPLDATAALQRKAAAEQEKQQTATQVWMQKNYPQYVGLPGDMGVKLALAAEEQKQKPQGGSEYDSRYAAGQQFGLSGEDLNTFVLTGAIPGTARSNVTYGTTPVWGQDASGKQGYGVTGTDGSFKIVDTGGFQPMGPGEVAASRTTGTVDAKTAAAARAALRSAEVSNVNTAKAIGEVRANAKGMNEWFGQVGPRGMYINPGSEMGKFWAAAEPTNNQAFMQAREALKGGGQITDYEGRKAEDAFSRMRAALEKGDQDQYLRALTDFEDAVALGYQKLQEAAQGGYGAGSPAVSGNTPAAGNAPDPLGIR